MNFANIHATLSPKSYLSRLFFSVVGLGLLVPFALYAKMGLVRYPIGRSYYGVPQRQTLEIRIEGDTREGLGAVIQNLKPVLLLANATGAVITSRYKFSAHGYRLNKFIRFGTFILQERIKCNTSRTIHSVLNRIINECNTFPYHELPRLFTKCNMIVVTNYPMHPRPCIRLTAPLIRAATRFPAEKAVREDVCILRRGGDVEKWIMSGKHNQWALDYVRMVPILDNVRRKGARIVLVTETSEEDFVRKKFRPHIISNKEPLPVVVGRLNSCRCLFVSSCSSFAITMVQISAPPHVIYTENHPGFNFTHRPYPYNEFGERAHSVLEDPIHLANLCLPPRKPLSGSR